MNIEIYYVWPNVKPDIYFPLYKQFDASLRKYACGQNVRLLHPDETNGKDIGAYIEAAKTCTAGIMVCLGSHVRINNPEWLQRIEHAWKTIGPGLYGPFGSNEPMAHLRTTAFWCAPSLLKNYPWEVKTDQDRYNFELSPGRSITTYTRDMKLTVCQLTRNGSYHSVFNCYTIPGDSLMSDKYTDMQEAARK